VKTSRSSYKATSSARQASAAKVSTILVRHYSRTSGSSSRCHSSPLPRRPSGCESAGARSSWRSRRRAHGRLVARSARRRGGRSTGGGTEPSAPPGPTVAVRDRKLPIRPRPRPLRRILLETRFRAPRRPSSVGIVPSPRRAARTPGGRCRALGIGSSRVWSCLRRSAWPPPRTLAWRWSQLRRCRLVRSDQAGMGKAPRLRSDAPTAPARGDHEGGHHLLSSSEAWAEFHGKGCRRLVEAAFELLDFVIAPEMALGQGAKRPLGG